AVHRGDQRGPGLVVAVHGEPLVRALRVRVVFQAARQVGLGVEAQGRRQRGLALTVDLPTRRVGERRSRDGEGTQQPRNDDGEPHGTTHASPFHLSETVPSAVPRGPPPTCMYRTTERPGAATVFRPEPPIALPPDRMRGLQPTGYRGAWLS